MPPRYIQIIDTGSAQEDTRAFSRISVYGNFGCCFTSSPHVTKQTAEVSGFESCLAFINLSFSVQSGYISGIYKTFTISNPFFQEPPDLGKRGVVI